MIGSMELLFILLLVLSLVDFSIHETSHFCQLLEDIS